MRKHSFTEYVADKFDTQLFYGVDKYIKENYKSMRLRLNKIRNIESIEVSDTKVKFVNVTDLPGMQIGFNVAVESELEIQDTDYRIEVERCYQWFMLKCSGSLECDLIDFNIINVSEYYNKGIIQNPLSDNLVPIINSEKSESVANDFLQKYYQEALKKPMYLDPLILANNMSLNVKLHKITQDSTIFGQIYFTPVIQNYTMKILTK
ncbi:MAG: hypothetical protein PHY08_14120 [Candidatus Cloacimonetes bacterium]|nr:hypothetical protein [Candidatus Cloacimonadota bacterium]